MHVIVEELQIIELRLGASDRDGPPASLPSQDSLGHLAESGKGMALTISQLELSC
jgi:hypothetical protein